MYVMNFTFMFATISGVSCPTISLSHSNVMNITGLFMDEHVVICEEGFIINNVTTSDTISCTENATWNMSEVSCQSEYQSMKIGQGACNFIYSKMCTIL